MAATGKRGRPEKNSPRQDELLAILRKRIIEGDLQPGDRLPGRHELKDTFGISYLTVQRALDRLMQSGFVEATPSKGTFVSPAPPHLSSFALIIPMKAHDNGYVRFWTALEQAALQMTNDAPELHRFRIWKGIEWDRTTLDFLRLEEDVREFAYGGLIFATHPYALKGSTLIDLPGIPRVAIRTSTKDAPAMGEVSVKGMLFFKRALERLVERGRRNLAVISVPGQTQEIGNLTALAEASGVTLAPHHIQFGNQSVPISSRNLAHLLFSNPSDRPDGLIVSDDNLTEETLRGLMLAGMTIPYDVEVVVHCNFPAAIPTSAPIHRLGYNARTVLEHCLSQIESIRRTGNPQPCLLVEPVFEEECSWER